MSVIGRIKNKFIPAKFFFLILLNILNFSFVSGEQYIRQMPQQKHYNIILISIDTLRADHLGCYGYFRNTSPNIDKFAKEGILFEQAISQAGATLPSHASIFTSQYPFVHGADTVATLSSLDETSLTLAEIMKNHGYQTAAFTGGGHLKKEYGIAQGFDMYYDEGDWNSNLGSFITTVPLALSWLKENKNNKFFLFLHGYDVHEPYYSSVSLKNTFAPAYKGIADDMDLSWEGLAKVFLDLYLKDDGKIVMLKPQDIQYFIARYDSGIGYADKMIGKFIKEIKEMGILNNTIVILLSDHGEDLFEHGHIGKHRSPYEEVLRVPLIIKHPEFTNSTRINTQVQLIDVMPTILEFLYIKINNDEIQGKCLLPLIEGKAEQNFNEFVYSHYGNGIVRSKKWKLIDKFALYNLENDPYEQHNIIQTSHKIALEYLQKLFDWTRENDILRRKIINQRGNTYINPVAKDNGYW